MFNENDEDFNEECNPEDEYISITDEVNFCNESRVFAWCNVILTTQDIPSEERVHYQDEVLESIDQEYGLERDNILEEEIIKLEDVMEIYNNFVKHEYDEVIPGKIVESFMSVQDAMDFTTEISKKIVFDSMNQAVDDGLADLCFDPELNDFVFKPKNEF